MIQKSVPLTEIGEHVETIREFMTEVEEPSDFVADALRRIEAEEARLLEDNRKQAEQIKALEVERDRHGQSAETWRKRVEQAAEALSDVLPGDVGRLDLLARIAELKRQRDEALALTAVPTGQVADADLWCDACAGLRPHRWKPSPDAGLFWRCSECSGAFRADSDPTETAAVVRMLTTLANKDRARNAGQPASVHGEPSGQVAEDAELVRQFMATGGTSKERQAARSALSRLAAMAQGYEAAAERCKAEITKAVAAETGRDAAVADSAALVAAGLRVCDAWQGPFENSGFRLSKFSDKGCPQDCIHCATGSERHAAALALRQTVSKQPHPGTALLEEMETLRAFAATAHGPEAWESLKEQHRKTTEALEACREHVRQTGEQHRKALVRARNEGLEKVAAKLLERRDQMRGRAMEDGRRRGLEEAAAIARAMKEPEQ